MDRGLAARVMKAAIVHHNMVFEARRNVSKSQLRSLAEKSVERGSLFDENGERKSCQWKRESNVSVNNEFMDKTR